MSHINLKKEPKLSIGCQVTESIKIRLLEEAKRKGYSSFSKYLEKLIIDSFLRSTLKKDSGTLQLELIQSICQKFQKDINSNIDFENRYEYTLKMAEDNLLVFFLYALSEKPSFLMELVRDSLEKK